ncbi:hypothetical protein [Acanthamoeba polyphaga mimivirus]|uniref:Uncharacterized protein n=1 Tax=Acanthamoeba polyphaga mimivirus TaxID=212035 RepID=A0A0G2Y065_MIMIV|nr:hypothetical protein [Acanthamoeba polyphaga mimivirus]
MDSINPQSEFNSEEFVGRFNVIGRDRINCEYLSQLLYSAIIQNLKIKLDDKEYLIFNEYQENVFQLIDSLREFDENIIFIVLEYLASKEYHYLIDCIIMWWCLPNKNMFMSKNMYNKSYKQNIEKFNSKLTNRITHSLIESFCRDALSKTNKIPIHCLDLLWYYMNGMAIDLDFYNSNNCLNVAIIVPEDEEPTDDSDSTTYVTFGINMEFILEMGIGKISYSTDPGKKKSFENYLWQFITSEDTIDAIKSSKSFSNYRSQVLSINKNTIKYFGSDLKIPESVINRLM